jgi:4-hydroxy-3-methylbut-2-enyl diphosphate reductase
VADSSKTNSSGAKSMAELMASHTSSFNVFKKGQEVEGIVKKLTPSEILLEIGAKSDALVLEVDKTNQDNLMRALKVGDKVKAVIISPESEGGFPVVSLRRALDNLMYANLDKFSASQEDVEVIVVEPTRGGYFVASETGMRGFLPTSQVITQESLTGKKILVKIIEVDRAKKRVIFSEKATAYITDPETLRKLLPKGTPVKVVIQQVAPYGLFVSLPGKDGKLVDGFIHISEISYERVENLPSLYKNGQIIEAAVLDVDTENRRVNLSVKATLKDNFTLASEKYKKEDKVKGAVTRVATRGVTIDLGDGVNGFIPADKIPADTVYKTGDSINAEVTDIDTRKRVVLLSPIVTKAFVGYR